ncbi:MAG TPA: DUF72 domain-containing protein [Polyangiaceae bacterium]
MSSRVHVGQAALIGKIERYARVFDFLEVRASPAPPSPSRMRRLRGEAPEGFCFSLVAPQKLVELSASEPDAALVEATRAAANALGARWLALRTPAAVAPSARARARLARLVELLRGAATGIAWEPRGVWTDEDAERAAAELDVVLVRDLAEYEPPPGPVIYTRLWALGRNSRIGAGIIERVAERIEDADEAFVIAEGRGAVGLAKQLRQIEASDVPNDDEDDEGEEDEDFAEEDDELDEDE